MKKTLSLLLLGLWFQFFLSAQELKIVKDNVNCTYGIKNDAGKWVINPDYVSIHKDELGYFRLKTGLTEGIASPKGKIILKAVFQYINHFHNQYIKKSERWESLATERFFQVWIDGHSGLFDSKGKEVFPIQYKTINSDEWPNIILIKEKDGRFYSSYADVFGKVHFKTKGCLGYFNQGNFAVVGEEYTDHPYFAKGKAGLIKPNGKWFIPPTYDEIYFNTIQSYNYPHSFKLIKNDKTLLLDKNGDEIKGNSYKIHSRSHPNEDLTNLNPNKVYIIEENNLLGFMKGDGTLLIKPRFSKLERKGYRLHPKPYWHWFAYDEQDRVGMITINGEIILEPLYESIIPRSYYEKQTNGSTIHRHHIVFTENGKYGLMSSEGDILVEATNDQYHYNGHSSDYLAFFSKGTSLKAFLFNTYPAKPVELDLFVHTDHFALYKAKLGTTVTNNRRSRSTRKDYLGFLIKDSILQVDQALSSKIEDSILYVTSGYKTYILFKNGKFIDDKPDVQLAKIHNMSQEFNKSYGYLYSDNKVGLMNLKKNKVQIPIQYHSMSLLSEQYATVATKDWLFGYLDIQSGKLLLKPQYASIRKAWSSYLMIARKKGQYGVLNPKTKQWQIEPKYLDFRFGMLPEGFIMAKIEHANKHSSSECGKWIMIDSSGNQLCDIEFDNPEIYKRPQYTLSNNRMGWFDPMAKKWIIPPNFRWMNSFTDSLFQVASLSGKYGLIHKNGELLIDTIYNCLEPIFSSTQYLPPNPTKYDINSWWEYSDGELKLLLSNKGQIVRAGKKQDSILFKSAFITSKALNSDTNQCYNCFKMMVPESQWNLLWEMNYIRGLYTIYKKRYKDQKGCSKPRDDSNCRNIVGRSLERTIRTNLESYSILLLKKKAVSVQRSWTAELFERRRGANTAWDNYKLEDGNLKTMELMDVVGNSSILYKEYNRALATADHLDLDCQNDQHLVQLIGQNWSFAKEGLQLHLFAMWGNYKGSLMIPWKQLQKYKETKAWANYFLKEN